MNPWQEFTAGLWFRKLDVAPFEGELASLQQPLVVRTRGRLLVALSVSGGFPRVSPEAELGELADELLLHAEQATAALALAALRDAVWQRFEAGRFDRALPEILAVAVDAENRLQVWRAGPNGVALFTEAGVQLASEDLRFGALQRQGVTLEERWLRDPLLREISELTQLEPAHAAQQEFAVAFREGSLCLLSRGALPFGVTSQPEVATAWWRRDAGWRHGMGATVVALATPQGMARAQAALQALEDEVRDLRLANSDDVGRSLVELHRAARQLIAGSAAERASVAEQLRQAGGEAWNLLATLAQDSSLQREARLAAASVLGEPMPRALLESVALSLLQDPDPALRGHGIVLCVRCYLAALVSLVEASSNDAATFREHDVDVGLGSLARAALPVLRAGRPEPRFPDWSSLAVSAPTQAPGAVSAATANDANTAADATDDADVSVAFLARRQALLSLAPEAIGLSRPNLGRQAFGILMETGYAEGTHTLACLVDGSVHNDFSNGIFSERLGDHAAVRAAAAAFLARAEEYYGTAVVTRHFPRPTEGTVRFFFLGAYEIRRYEAAEDALTNDRDPLSTLYHVAHELLAEIYAVERSQAASQPRDEEAP